MKPKDITYLLIAVAIFAVAGYFAYGQIHQSQPKALTVEVPPTISDQFDNQLLGKFDDFRQIRDFTPVFDLTQGLNNATPFNPI